MRPVSERFLRTLTGSHTAIFRARVVAPGQTGTNPVGVEFKIIDGDVQLDAGADIRSTIEVTFDGQAPWPSGASSDLVPYGNEVFAERGIAYGGGAVEWVSLGYFRIDDIEQERAPDGPIRVSGPDRMSLVVDAVLTDVRQYDSTATYGAVVDDLVLDAYPDAVIEWDDPDVAGDAVGRSLLFETDRYAALRELVLGLGKIAYFDHRGYLVIRTPPVAYDPVWTVARGEGGVLIAASRSLSRKGVYNGVLATGEALDTEAPARGLAVDTGADSPTRWGGPFGKIPRTYSSPVLTTDAQAELAAGTILRRSLGLPYNVDLTGIPNPALEPEDAIEVGFDSRPAPSPPLQLVGDSFTRTVSPGWGTGESGEAWLTVSAVYAVAGGVGTATLAANVATMNLNSVSAGRLDTDCYIDVRVPPAQGAVAGASLVSGVVVRAVNSADCYACRLEFNPGGTVTAKISRDSPTYGSADVQAVAGFGVFTLGQWWTIRARARGEFVQLKAWPRDAPEPREWTLTHTDPGRWLRGVRSGMYFWRVSGNTNGTGPQWEVDNWRTYTAPQETLRGGELHVIDTLTIPLTAAGAMTATTREQSLTTIEASA